MKLVRNLFVLKAGLNFRIFLRLKVHVLRATHVRPYDSCYITRRNVQHNILASANLFKYLFIKVGLRLFPFGGLRWLPVLLLSGSCIHLKILSSCVIIHLRPETKNVIQGRIYLNYTFLISSSRRIAPEFEF